MANPQRRATSHVHVYGHQTNHGGIEKQKQKKEDDDEKPLIETNIQKGRKGIG